MASRQCLRILHRGSWSSLTNHAFLTSHPEHTLHPGRSAVLDDPSQAVRALLVYADSVLAGRDCWWIQGTQGLLGQAVVRLTTRSTATF